MYLPCIAAKAGYCYIFVANVQERILTNIIPEFLFDFDHLVSHLDSKFGLFLLQRVSVVFAVEC